MRQPYIYTLPEQFINDPSVPTHWKLYTLINGFWISGKPVYASNAFFAAKLKCSERHIQGCLEKLESIGVLNRVGKSQNRTIMPISSTVGGRTETSYLEAGGRTDSSVRDEPTVRHISDSNSDKTSELEIRIEEEDKPQRKAKYPHSKEVFALFKGLSRGLMIDRTQCEHASLLYEERGLEKIKGALAFYEKVKGSHGAPEIDTPYDLSTKWHKLINFDNRTK